MHGEYVFDSKINVKYLKEKDSANFSNSRNQEGTNSESEVNEANKQMYGVSGSVAGARSLPVTPHYPTNSPVVGPYPTWSGMHCGHQGMYQPPAGYTRSYQNSNDFSRPFMDRATTPSPIIWQQPPGSQPAANRFWEDRNKSDRGRLPVRRSSHPLQGSSYNSDGQIYRGKGSNPNNARVGSLPQSSEWNSLPKPPWTSSAPQGHGYGGPAYNQPPKRRSSSPMFSTTHPSNHWNGQGLNSTSFRSDRTPSPYDLSCPIPVPGQQADRHSPYSDVESLEVENFFNPINNQRNCSSNAPVMPIELQVTNLDQNIDPKEMKRILSQIFMEHVMVMHISVFVQSDGNFAATVKVPSLPEAQYAISQLHRRKIGYKRILISYAHTGGPNPQIVRSQIVMLLQEVPGHKLPLFKFREMYESRYMISISVSELYKLKDVCIITDDPSGRMVALNPDHRNTPSPSLNTTADGQPLDFPYCTIHPQKPWSDKGWAEQEMATLPNIMISLKVLSERVHKMLTTHYGNLPLPSFPSCYEAEFKESLLVDENGVPLEHLVSCLSSVEVKQGNGGVKHVIWATNKDHDESHEENKCISPPLANQLALFSRELVDLLKTAPHCQLSFNRFIPAYHHHFGRQCRVADYGFTKLIDLLEALSHTVQVMGEGNKRVVTLSHRAQVRRFTSDLLRVLKAQASKQVTLSEFPGVYARVIGKAWDVCDYGVCEIDDILGEVSENTVVVTSCNNERDRLIAIPKREQTPEEIERTRQFAIEVVELLKHAPQQRMLFNKFVPSYHHHFGHQCRVSDYGFTKLIELFEAIPDIVKIEDVVGGERRIALTETEGIRVLGEQISKLISRTPSEQLNVATVAQAFLQEFGYVLRPESFNCNSMVQLMQKLEGTIKVVNIRGGVAVVSIDKTNVQNFGLECRRVLMDATGHCLLVEKFTRLYEQIYHKPCGLAKYACSLDNYVHLFTTNGERFIELTPIQRFACKVYHVLMQHGGKIYMSQFESAYLKIVGSTCRVAQYGFPTLYALLKALPCTVNLKELRHKRKVLIQLNKKLAAVGIPLPNKFSQSPHQDTDSSNDSIGDNDYFGSSFDTSVGDSSALNPSNLRSDEWDNNAIASSQFSWNKESNSNSWETNADPRWVLSSSHDPQKWSTIDNKTEGFLDNLECQVSEFSLSSKQDSPQDEHLKNWKSSIWSTPPNFNFSQDLHSTNIEVPPLTWSPLNAAAVDQASDLLSPTKSLLTAAANPLDPRVSPYYSSKINSVRAPDPSELPLPSMRIYTPNKNLSLDGSHDPVCTSKSSSELSITPITPENKSGIENDSGINDTRVESTPSKRSYIGKCRLAAQFNQAPPETNQ